MGDTSLSILKAEIEKKRKLLPEVSGGKKWLKRADIEAELRRRRAEETKSKKASSSKSGESDGGYASAESSKSPMPRPPSALDQPSSEQDSQAEKVPAGPKRRKADVIRVLRQRGEPVTLFGETDAQREDRLRTLEASEPENMEGDRNVFQELLLQQDKDHHKEDKDAGSESDEDSPRGSKKKKARPLVPEGAPASSSAAEGDVAASNQEQSREDVIRSFLKRLMNEWEQELNERPDAVKRTAQGKVDTAICKQCRKYIKPLFKELRTGRCPAEIVEHVHSIVGNMQRREYVLAHEEYMQLAIGNAPWPMGVTMVGIHERSAREKIFTNQVAHVLNDETQRKYIQSLKRLMTFCQRKYPAAPSKMVF